MPNLNPRNLEWVRQIPSIGPRLYECLIDIVNSINNVAQQVAASAAGNTPAPPNITALAVTAANGVFTASITDNNQVYRGISYFLEISSSAAFDSPIVVFLGPSRNWMAFLGSGTFYFRAYSAYQTSKPSSAVYFGSGATPTGVAGGGAIAGAALPTSGGSGTASGLGTQGGQGFGSTPFRSTTGSPPKVAPSGGSRIGGVPSTS